MGLRKRYTTRNGRSPNVAVADNAFGGAEAAAQAHRPFRRR